MKRRGTPQLIAAGMARAGRRKPARGRRPTGAGPVITVKYKDGEKKIVVTPDSVLRAYVIGSRDELKPGAQVAAFAVKKPDGTLEAPRINVGRDGVVPQ